MQSSSLHFFLGPFAVIRVQAQLVGIAVAGLLGLFVPWPLLAAQAGDRFAIETHAVGTELREEPLRITFKLDTVTGNVWRFTGTKFLPVDVPVGGVSGYATWSTPALDEQRQGRRRRENLQRRMKMIIIPEINFQKASVRNALKFLSDASKEFDPDKEGVKIVFRTGMRNGVGLIDSDDLFALFGTDPFAPPAPDPAAMPEDEDPSTSGIPITFTAKYVTLYDALAIIVNLADLRYRLWDDTILVGPKDPPTEWRRPYFLRAKLVEQLRNDQPQLFEPAVHSSDDLAWMWMMYFGTLGVPMCSEPSITFHPETRELIFTSGDESALAHYEHALKLLESYPPRAGRFRLQPLAEAAQRAPAVVLLDTETGDAWFYEILGLDGENRTVENDEFLRIPPRSFP